MKWTGYILAFYLVLLSAAPCCIIDDCPDDKIEQTTTHESGDEDCGNCSPFFSCEGCATATINSKPLQFETITFTTVSVYTLYLQPVLPLVNYDFWQPPRLT